VARSTASAASPPVRSGIGSARIGSGQGVRWRGELAEVAPPAAADGEESAESGYDEIVDETIEAAPAWLVSLVIHLVVLLALALIASPAGQRIGRIALTIGEAETPQEVEFSVFEESEDTEAIDSPVEETAFDVPVDIPVAEFDSVLPTPPLESLPPVDIGLGESAMEVKPMVSGRSGAMKRALLAAFGGTAATEEAVELGLAWLAKQQLRDGSWMLSGPFGEGAPYQNKPAATAMALLAFQGAGNTHLEGPYAEQVHRGMKYLVAQQDREGFFARSSKPRHARMYSQAQASIAICELYAMTKDSWLREPAQRAIRFAEAAQSGLGGWRYEPREGADVSVTGWFVMALESGRSAGLEVDRAVLYGVDEYLDSVQSYEGAGYSYQGHGSPSQAMTAEGILCRQYLGWERDHPAMQAAVASLSGEYNFDIQTQDFYYWYYATQVLHHYGGEPWRAWNYRMREELPAAQVRRGREAGSWSPQRSRWGSSGGRLYTTCLAIYCLEVYYRHLPLYSQN